MSVNRFEKIRQFLHFNDNTKCLPRTDKNYDNIFKVRPVVKSGLVKCRKLPQEECQSIDEQILPTKGRSALKQYIPKKPNKWGIKVWARYGVSGMVNDFEADHGIDDIPSKLMGGMLSIVWRKSPST